MSTSAIFFNLLFILINFLSHTSKLLYIPYLNLKFLTKIKYFKCLINNLYHLYLDYCALGENVVMRTIVQVQIAQKLRQSLVNC